MNIYIYIYMYIWRKYVYTCIYGCFSFVTLSRVDPVRRLHIYIYIYIYIYINIPEWPIRARPRRAQRPQGPSPQGHRGAHKGPGWTPLGTLGPPGDLPGSPHRRQKQQYLKQFKAPESLRCCIRRLSLQRISPMTRLDCFIMYMWRTEPFLSATGPNRGRAEASGGGGRRVRLGKK